MPIISDKRLKIAFMIFSLACFVAAGVCLICNYAINRGVTWAAYPLLCIPFAWIIAAPLMLAPKHRTVFSLSVFSVLVFPFLYLLQTLTPVSGWFWPLAAPIAAVSVPSFWLTLWLAKIWWTKKLLLGAFLLIFYGIFVSGAVRYFVSSFLNTDFFSFDIMINILACISTAALFGIIGYARRKDNA